MFYRLSAGLVARQPAEEVNVGSVLGCVRSSTLIYHSLYYR